MMNSTAHDDDYDDDDCDNDAGGCDNDACTGNHDIMFDTITAAADDDNGGIGCDNGGWQRDCTICVTKNKGVDQLRSY